MITKQGQRYVIVVGGFANVAGVGADVPNVDAYNVETDSWQVMNNFISDGVTAIGGIAFYYEGKERLLMFGGKAINPNRSNGIYEFNADADSWTLLADPPPSGHYFMSMTPILYNY